MCKYQLTHKWVLIILFQLKKVLIFDMFIRLIKYLIQYNIGLNNYKYHLTFLATFENQFYSTEFYYELIFNKNICFKI